MGESVTMTSGLNTVELSKIQRAHPLWRVRKRVSEEVKFQAA
jgi:hypothetical protein